MTIRPNGRFLMWGLCAAATGLMACATGRSAVVAGQHDVAAPGEKAQPAAGVPYTSQELGFELDKPAGEDWALATDVTSPEGRPIPVVVAHPDSGAQIVVQVSEPMGSPKDLAQLLRSRLQEEGFMRVGGEQQLQIDSGADAYGFDFSVEGEAAGRVAVIEVGQQFVLVIASWPENADGRLVSDIDEVVRSVRAPGSAEPAMVRPDKA